MLEPTVSNQILVQGVGAFAGAAFVFLFDRLANFFSKVYQRQVKHYNSLVILETQLNELGGIAHDNIYLIPFFKNTLASGNIYFSKLRQFPIDRSHYENLNDIELINELFSFNYQLRKLNDDIDSLADGYTDIKNAFIAQNITKQEYLINSAITIQSLDIVEKFLLGLEDQTIKLMAMIRISIRRDTPLITKFMRIFVNTNHKKLDNKEIDKEVEKLRKEIEEVKTESRKENEEILKRYSRSS